MARTGYIPGTLTLLQKRFVQEFAIDLCAAAAYRRAGYKGKDVDRKANTLMKVPHVRDAVDKILADKAKRASVTADMVIAELANIAFSNATDVVAFQGGRLVVRDTSELPDQVRSCISELSEVLTEAGSNRKVKMYDKVKALELLGKHFKLFSDRMEISGEMRVMTTEMDEKL